MGIDSDNRPKLADLYSIPEFELQVFMDTQMGTFPYARSLASMLHRFTSGVLGSEDITRRPRKNDDEQLDLWANIKQSLTENDQALAHFTWFQPDELSTDSPFSSQRRGRLEIIRGNIHYLERIEALPDNLISIASTDATLRETIQSQGHFKRNWVDIGPLVRTHNPVLPGGPIPHPWLLSMVIEMESRMAYTRRWHPNPGENRDAIQPQVDLKINLLNNRIYV
jgi:hypothetical protein